MRDESVAILDIRSNEVTFLLGAKGVNDTFVFSGMQSENYEGYCLEGFFDEDSFRRAVGRVISSVQQNYGGYTNPNVPWSVNFNYSYSYRKAYQFSNDQVITKHTHTQTLGISGNVKITPRLSMNLSTNFDLMAMKMSTTQLSATYDLHCFNINVSWIPTGQWESWSFRIQANAAALADLLKFKKSSSYWDNNY